MSEIALRVAAKAVIVNASGEVLFVRESSTHQTNTNVGGYGIPGGKLEPGESFLDGLAREVMEEVGLTVQPVKPLGVGEWRPFVLNEQHQIIAIFMLCEIDEDSEVTLSDEHDDFGWFSVNAMQDEALKFKEPDRKIASDYLKQSFLGG